MVQRKNANTARYGSLDTGTVQVRMFADRAAIAKSLLFYRVPAAISLSQLHNSTGLENLKSLSATGASRV